MSSTCNRCYRIVSRPCQSDTERADCPHLERAMRDKIADRVDGYDRDDLGESPDY